MRNTIDYLYREKYDGFNLSHFTEMLDENEGMDFDHILSMKEERSVQGDHTINYKAKLYQILPTKTRFGFAKAKVAV